MLNIVIKSLNKSLFFINSQLLSKKTAAKAASYLLTFSVDESWLRDKVMYLHGHFLPTMSRQARDTPKPLVICIVGVSDIVTHFHPSWMLMKCRRQISCIEDKKSISCLRKQRGELNCASQLQPSDQQIYSTALPRPESILIRRDWKAFSSLSTLVSVV